MENCAVRLRKKIGFAGVFVSAGILMAGFAASGQKADQAWLKYR
jgi:hypothetical protein